MALFGFRTRNPERDRETDESRQQRLRQFLGDLRAEIQRERDGLKERYEKITADAAFSQQALEDNRAAADTSSKIDEMTESMIRYTKRIGSLEQQISFMNQMLGQAELFSQSKISDESL
ncbi:MAG: hypothetical protein WBA88_03245 [Pseudaminobacter sp.]